MTGLASGKLSDAFGDFIVYRNLIPVDDRLPTIRDLRSKAGLVEGQLPRKAEPAYASVVGEILCQARRLSGLTSDGTRLLYVGDTMHNDVCAFSNLCQAMGWEGSAFIADEDASTCRQVHPLADRQRLTVSSQWGDIAAFAEEASVKGLGCDEGTVVVVDIDKTLLGARGRNDHAIDRARLKAAYEVAHEIAGTALADEAAFAQIYGVVNSSAFHPLTEDNQDAIAYVSLLVACGTVDLDQLTASVSARQIEGFRAFVANSIETRRSHLSRGLSALQKSIHKQLQAGNPTPFTLFRQAEYRCTTGLMGYLPDTTSREEMLDQEIVITEEVWMAIKRWRSQGCIIFGLSDKPDEACFPSDAANADALPLHLTQTHIIGSRR